jgi:hypothetical protein
VDRHHHQGSPPVKGIHRGGDHEVAWSNAAHEVARLAVATLPVVTFAPEVMSVAQI